MIERRAGIGPIEPEAKLHEGGLWIGGEIDCIVGKPAEGIKRRGWVAHAPGQQERGGEERL
jgi:hypothetical protein